MQNPGAEPEKKIRWRLRAIKFDRLKFILCCVVLAPILAMAPIFAIWIFNHMLFLPFKIDGDVTPYFKKLEIGTQSKMTDLTIPRGAQKIDAWYFKKVSAKKIIIVSHGNAGEMAHRLLLAVPLLSTNSSLLLYDYEGYGKSTGEPTIPTIRQDGLAVYDYVHNVLHYAPENIILYGESLGSGVTTYIAQNRTASGIIIQSGFTSLSTAVKDRFPLLNFCPPAAFADLEMDNAAYLRGKHPPLLLIHGDADTEVSIKHAYKSFEDASEPKRFVKIEGCGHHDIYTSKLFTPALCEFTKTLPPAT